MIFALPLALGTQAGSSLPATGVAFRPPNVVVVLLDDVGTDKLAAYGLTPAWNEPHARTPVLDHLRANGVLFTRVWSAPLCSPSRAMLMTGRYGFRTGMLGLSEVSGPCPPGTVSAGGGTNLCCPTGDPTCSSPKSTPVPPLHATGYSLPDDEVTIAEALRHASFPTDVRYTSGAFGKWHLTASPGDPCHPIRQGFDVFQGHLHNNEIAHDHYGWVRVDALAAQDGCTSTTASVQGEWDAERTAIDARAWIDGVLAEPEDRPFFAFVSFNPPHTPFQVPPRALVSPETWADLVLAGLAEEGRVADGVSSCSPTTTHEFGSRDARLVYRASLEAVDALIGRVVLRSQAEPEILANTLVFVVSDNGTPDHVCQATQNTAEIGVNAPPFPPNRAKFHVYELGVRVPMIAAGPNVAHGETCNTFVSLVDLWATIADRANADASGLVPSEQLDSRSFAHRLARPNAPPSSRDRTALYTESATRNGFVYDPDRDSWSPFAPVAARYQRAVLDESGFKYVRRVLGSDPGCVPPLSVCEQPAEEELFRLFDGASSVDPFEAQSMCGTPDSDARLALMRQRMASGFSGY